MKEVFAIIILIGILVIGGYMVLRDHNWGNAWLPLSTEIGSDIVVIDQSIQDNIAGTVWQIQQGPEGLFFVKKDTQLVEELQLDNVTLQGGDIISWHGSDLLVDGVDDYVDFGDSPFGLTGTALTVSVAFELSKSSVTYAPDIIYSNIMQHWIYDSNGDYYNIVLHAVNDTGFPWSNSNIYSSKAHVNEYHVLSQIVWKGASYWEYASIIDDNVVTGTSNISVATYPYVVMPFVSLSTGQQYSIRIVHDFAAGMKGRISYVYIAAYKETPENIVRHIITKQGTCIMFDATWYNGTHFITLDGTAGTPYGNPQRVPATETWLWLIKNAETDTNIHVKFMPPGTILKLKDTITGQTWQYTVTGVQNQAGLIEDYTIAPPTSNPVDIVAYIPSERARFYAPDGFTIRVSNTEKEVSGGQVTLGYTTSTEVQLLAKNEDKLSIILDDTGPFRKIIVRKADGTPAVNAFVWVRDTSGKLLSYGQTDTNGEYKLNTDDSIEVEAWLLEDGTWYKEQRTFLVDQPVEGIRLSYSQTVKIAAGAAALFFILLIIVVLVNRH